MLRCKPARRPPAFPDRRKRDRMRISAPRLLARQFSIRYISCRNRTGCHLMVGGYGIEVAARKTAEQARGWLGVRMKPRHKAGVEHPLVRPGSSGAARVGYGVLGQYSYTEGINHFRNSMIYLVDKKCKPTHTIPLLPDARVCKFLHLFLSLLALKPLQAALQASLISFLLIPFCKYLNQPVRQDFFTFKDKTVGYSMDGS